MLIDKTTSEADGGWEPDADEDFMTGGSWNERNGRAPDGQRSTAPRPAGRKRRLAFLCLLLLVVGGFIAGGFLRFAESTAEASRIADVPQADAIVVLTGGANRIERALALLKAGHGKRLLISGVNKDTSAGAIARTTNTDPRWFACCVDIDMAALDTVGNAVEALRWADEHGFDDLILVTSDYHMSRSLIEFDRMGDLKRITPVAVRLDDLWRDDIVPTRRGLEVLVTEYAKLMAARIRAAIVGAEPIVSTANAEPAG
ncbi:YdcF family protein [Fulvimarina sp. 2208YS6-2-32]|uniref:YdcF family protein n=1 Tax=Fulvimarina uroteuthidis TaxID=3098149 RepID=A0ABU5HZF8_9HYPH|nr:YdcF family protein [Fulvimarina sp. 2208YS6-2-32]MDY8108514.1 YdcF family protein [Fulvimarina sp. 2208YS6-2-32]